MTPELEVLAEVGRVIGVPVIAIIAVWVGGRLSKSFDHVAESMRDIKRLVEDHATRIARLEGAREGGFE